ncbi:MAG: DUF3987 domain-containing protein [Clostridia bacterium]|nr:DUF3987 domain-containing protein [Clostridia bacterium]MBR6185468.1 DUF3987 domain-containing protein [Clostridia bacterium]
MTVISQLAAATGQAENNQTWPELPDGAQAVPDFPAQVLPDDLRLLIRSIAKAHQVSEGMAAAFALGVASAAIVGRVEIQPKAGNPGYTEPGQIYVLCQGESGERKTPVLRSLKAPLESWLDEQRAAIQASNRHTKNRIEATKAAAKREKDPAKAAALLDEVDDLEAKLQPDPEYMQADLTVESVTKAMADHGGRAVVLADEADFLSVLAGNAYSREGASVNLGAVLSGYTNEGFHGQRVGRGEWHIPRASLAFCLGVQPGLLRKFMSDSFGADRGLHARFLFFLPRSMIGKRSNKDEAVPSSVSDWWDKTIRRLAGIAREGVPLRIRFDTYAEAAYRVFFDQIEKRLVGDLGGDMKGWGGKMVGNTVRVAGILALLDGAEEVRRVHWDAAEVIAKNYLIPCAVSLYRGDDPSLSENTRKLLSIIRDLDSFSETDLWREKGRYSRLKKDGYGLALLDLCEHGYIRQAARQPVYCGTGRKPSPIWEVNPALHGQKKTVGQVIEL